MKLSTNLRKVCVTGGSGFLGVNLIRTLLRAGVEVVSLDVAPFDFPESNKISIFAGDIRDRAIVEKALVGCDAVVHAAAALPLYSKRDIYSTDVDGTRNVMEAALIARVKRVIHISSTAVYGVPDHHPLREEDALVGVGHYGTAKIKAERVVESYREQITSTILRPKSFIGPERLGVFALLFDWASAGLNFPIPGPGSNRYQYLDVEDLCRAIWLALTTDYESANDTFNIGAERFGTFKSDFQQLLDHAGFGKRVISVPSMPAILALRGLNHLRLSPLYPWVYETAVKDSFVSIVKAKEVLGYSPIFSNSESLIRNYDWYIENKGSFAGKSGVGHRVPWKQGALSLAKVFFR